MKNCNEMVSSLLERREQYEAEQKRKRKLIMTTAIPLGCLCLIAVLGVGVWQSGILGTSDIPQDKNDSVIAGGEGDRNDAFCGDYWVVGDGDSSGGEDNFATSTAPEDEPEESNNSASTSTDSNPEDSKSSPNDIMIPLGMVIVDGVTYVETNTDGKTYTHDTCIGGSEDFDGTYNALDISAKYYTTKEDPDVLLAFLADKVITLVRTQD